MNSTRENLIAAAARLVDDGGPAAVTLRDVGRLAGVSHNAPYKHFTGKQDLLAAVAARELHALATAMRSAAGGCPSAAAAVEASSVAYLEWAWAHPARFKLVFGPWSEPHQELGDAATAATRVFQEQVTAAHDEGAFRGDPAWTADLLRALNHGAVDLALSGHLQKHPNAPGARDLVGLLIRTLSRPEE